MNSNKFDPIPARARVFRVVLHVETTGREETHEYVDDHHEFYGYSDDRETGTYTKTVYEKKFSIRVYLVNLGGPRTELRAKYNKACEIVENNPDLGLTIDPEKIRATYPLEDELVLEEGISEGLANELLPRWKDVKLKSYDIYNQLVLVWSGCKGHYIQGIIDDCRGDSISWSSLGEMFTPASSLEEEDKPMAQYFEDILKDDPQTLGLNSDFDDRYQI